MQAKAEKAKVKQTNSDNFVGVVLWWKYALIENTNAVSRNYMPQIENAWCKVVSLHTFDTTEV